MKANLGAHCDDFYTSCRLFLKLDLTLERETVLHFFDRIRREYPSLGRMRRREDGGLVLEEADPEGRDGQSRRWIRLEPGAVRFGYFAPPSSAEYRRYAATILENAPHHLTLSDLDIDYLEVVYGFDLVYAGNHDRLVAETFYVDHPFASFLLGQEAVHTIDCQPSFGITLTGSCDTQAYLEVKGRTTSYEVRTGEFDDQLLSVYLTVRRYWGFGPPTDLAKAFQDLAEVGEDLAVKRVVPLVVNPLAHAIASRP
ncbi:MAG: hypothetical protein HY718_15950 [Planctomycetes bacterium]|nr:hypothetical protein [Planctomycetota bacterium]